MSVGLLVTSKSNRDHRELLPVAPQSIFVSKWLPGCSELKLTWVPLFETGIVVDSSNASAVLEELHQLRAWMAGRAGYQYEAERIARLIDGVENARTRPDLDIFIG
jgi:hypothetical protein